MSWSYICIYTRRYEICLQFVEEKSSRGSGLEDDYSSTTYVSTHTSDTHVPNSHDDNFLEQKEVGGAYSHCPFKVNYGHDIGETAHECGNYPTDEELEEAAAAVISASEKVQQSSVDIDNFCLNLSSRNFNSQVITDS